MKKDNAVKQQKNSVKEVPGRPFKKGESGNPNGRPKKELCFTEELKRKLSQITKHDKDLPVEEQRTRLQAICDKILEQAEGGDHYAHNLIFERIEGKVKEQLELSGSIHYEFYKHVKELSDKTPEEVIGEINRAIQSS
jgi:hypothetical protein